MRIRCMGVSQLLGVRYDGPNNLMGLGNLVDLDIARVPLHVVAQAHHSMQNVLAKRIARACGFGI